MNFLAAGSKLIFLLLLRTFFPASEMGEKAKVARCINLPPEGRAYLSRDGVVGILSQEGGKIFTRYYACTKPLLEEEIQSGG